MKKLVSIDEANAVIDAGRPMHVAGDESALRRLNRGAWIGGTIPYFLTRAGGVVEREKVFVNLFPDEVTEVSIRLIDIGHILSIASDAPRNGFSLIIVPALSDIHTAYALTANNMPGFFEHAIVGWTSGVHLDEIGKRTPKVFNGETGEVADDRIVVLHANLPHNLIASVGTINPFQPGSGDEIVFKESGFVAKDCTINGEPDNFFDYVRRTKLDTKLPLITKRSGHNVNVSFQSFDEEKKAVRFYAPVLRGQVYRLAAPMPDYRAALIEATEDLDFTPTFSCNCILNYLYGKLEGTQYIPVPGPATFGEVAHILLNQTLVYLRIDNR